MKLNQPALLAAAGLAGVLVAAAWQTLTLPPARAVPDVPPPDAAEHYVAAATRALPEPAAFARWRLFGVYEPEIVDGAGETPSAPPLAAAADETSLPDATTRVRLVGILAAGDTSTARAIVAETGDAHRRYSVGDVLPGGAVIDAIHAKAVVITHKGRRESMRLPDYDAGGRAAERASAPGTPGARRPRGNPALAARPS